ncbi:bergaptol O-methyltransferase-like [Cryptomeria japonica]|uniref:bergaptol O-methyltransferase-like n=1 Tax=Cryptomeria japonica TaxID=3369 RepID=UPI0027DA301A|nr:bergaptol O-methyltransferase-like [Cryptomeria japonica]
MEAHLYLYELILSATKPRALKEHMAEKILSVDEIAEHIPASTKNKVPQKEYLFRILRLLASCGIFTEDVHDPTSLWHKPLDVSSNAEATELFNQAMAYHTKDVMAFVVTMYDGFKSVKSVVDVGGVGLHCLLYLGINFYLPHVIATAPAIPDERPHLSFQGRKKLSVLF